MSAQEEATEEKEQRQADAPKKVDQRKILRIGVVQAGKIVEEKLIRRRESVTIGASPRNAIVVPASSLPRSFALFELSGHHYHLVFNEAMEGRLSLQGRVLTLAQAREEKLAVRGKGGLYRLALEEGSRGKVVLGEVTLLFQFVAPPPIQPRPQLPPSVRGSFISNMDWPLATSYAASAVVMLSFVGYLHALDVPRHIEPDVIPDNFARYLPTVQPPEQIDIDQTLESVGEKKRKKKAVKKTATDRDNKPGKKAAPVCDEACQAVRAAERRARIAEQVSKLGALKLLGTKGQGTGAVANLLAGGDPGAAADKAFQNVGGLSVDSDTGTGLRGVDGAATGDRVDIGNLGGRVSGPRGVKTGAMVQEKVPKAVLKRAGKTEVDGTLKADAVARVIRRGMAAIRSCYQRALKRNPSLSGKITIRLTVSPVGRVTAIEFDVDTLSDPQVTSCIEGYARRWRFPPPDEGDIAEIAVPFVFQAAN